MSILPFSIDWYNILQYTLTIVMLSLCFPRKDNGNGSVPACIGYALLFGAGAVITNTLSSTVAAHAAYASQVSYYLYALLLVFWSMLYAILTRKVRIRQSLFTTMFYFCNFPMVGAIAFTLRRLVSWFPATLVQYLVMALLLIYYWKITVPITLPFSRRYWILLNCVPVILIILVGFFSHAGDQRKENLPYVLAAVIVTWFLTLLVYALFMQVILEFTRQNDLALQNQNLAFQVRQMDNMQAMLENTRKARHELRNNYFYIEALTRAGERQKVLDYLHETIEPSFARNEMVQTGHHFLDMVLSQKFTEARQKNIPIVQNIQLPGPIRINQQMLCSLLFNLFDNAIEASAKVGQPDIHFTMTEVKGYLRIEIANRIDQSVLSGNPQLHTSKKDAHSHGLGMGIIRQIVEHYDGDLQIHEQNGCFIVEVMLSNRAD